MIIVECTTVPRAMTSSHRHREHVAISGRFGIVCAIHANDALVEIFGVSVTLEKTVAKFAVLWSGDDAGGEGEGKGGD